ncbi:MAG: hypothetical protein JO058_04410 [Alphaproteobacteria bacterium]|nr:hypothetical protein [Alphaproteobacteria bacterium]
MERLDEVIASSAAKNGSVLAVDDALTALARLDPRKARVVEPRFFGGLTIDETAGVLKILPDSVMRD